MCIAHSFIHTVASCISAVLSMTVIACVCQI